MTTQVKLIAKTVKNRADKADFEALINQHLREGWTIVHCTITPTYRPETDRYQDRYNVLFRRDHASQAHPEAPVAPAPDSAHRIKHDRLYANWLVTYHDQLRALDARVAALQQALPAAEALER